jgi:ferrous iron transport protein A
LQRRNLTRTAARNAHHRYNENSSHFNTESFPMRLTDLSKGASAFVARVEDASAPDPIAQRLRDLGFVPGEPVRVVARAPWSADPLLVQIGSTRFALRRAEAERVTIQIEAIDATDTQAGAAA